ncbi:polysaccharide lyase family protein [Streptomyces sp. NBC_01335]|uniref:polysaccharide lyase family protein n=1 Tax=Streptomyces sp. NBC_01335 TaxID=2903828 RepID=UPI002E1572FD|nr:polysaccharide lyase family protein [Streptomyces sp. NBC_01335]
MSSPIARRTVLGLMGAAALTLPHATAAMAAGPARAAAGPDVTLVDNGSTATLANGLIQFTVVKATARITDLRLLAGPQADSSTNLFAGAHGNGYTEFNYSGAPKAVTLTGAVFSVVSRTPDRVEISMLADDPAQLGFYVDIRMAVERGRPGIYNYWIVKYPEDMPDGLTLTQLRYAYAADTPAFRWFVVDDERGIQQRPTAEELKEAVTLQDSTVVLPDGTLYSKYQNKSNLEGDNHVFMISDGRVGLSLVQASKESFGSPTRQELTCHDYYDGMILLWHPVASHYTANVEVSKGWEKVYGPSYLHVGGAAAGDERANVEALWKDAKQAAAVERAQWPYKWITDPTYAAADRSSVSGKLSVASLGSVENGWALLYQPEPDREYQEITLDGDDWQYAGRGYVYAARIAPNGRFTIPAVRPGTYTLAAFARGALGEYRRAGIEVPASKSVQLGTQVWKPTSHGKTLWQIGTPDRTSQEFHIHGGEDGYFKTLTWLEYPYEFPEGVDFKVGVDDPATQWNYFHPAVRTPGTPAQLQWRGTTPDDTLEAWKIRFDSRSYRRGTGYLDISLAASVFSTLAVTLNGSPLASFTPVPGVRGDGSSYRLAARAAHRTIPTITFPADLIQDGENVLTLAPVDPAQAPTSDNWMQPMSGVMYDAIRLQVDRA